LAVDPSALSQRECRSERQNNHQRDADEHSKTHQWKLRRPAPAKANICSQSVLRSNHPLIKTFWPGFTDRQLADGTLIVTTRTGHTYTTTPAANLYFPTWPITTPAPNRHRGPTQ
jgi:hypothetical protein